MQTPVDSSGAIRQGQGKVKPAVANGVVYIGSDDNNVYALEAETGTLLWNYTTDGVVRSSPAVENGVVYIGGNICKISALNASTGALLWNYTAGSPPYQVAFVTSSRRWPTASFTLGIMTGTSTHSTHQRGTPLELYDRGLCVLEPAVANGIVCFGSWTVTSMPQRGHRGSGMEFHHGQRCDGEPGNRQRGRLFRRRWH